MSTSKGKRGAGIQAPQWTLIVTTLDITQVEYIFKFLYLCFMLNGLSLFSGIGGIDVALSGFVKPIAYCEIDPYCQSVLLSRMQEGHLPKAPIWGDITSLDKACIDEILCLQQEADDIAGKLKKFTEEQVLEAVKSYEEGMSLSDIAHIYGVTRQAVWYLLHTRTQMRSNLKYGKDNHFYRGGARADARANDILDNELRYGRIVNPGRCEICSDESKFKDGRTAIQGHHDDYNKPLSVRWLCQKCHHEWHKHNRPIPFDGEGGKEVNADDIDIIYGGFP